MGCTALVAGARRLQCAGAVALACAAAAAQACPPLPAAEAAAVRAAARSLDDAIRTAQHARIEPWVSKRFLQILGDGERVGRERFVAALSGAKPAVYTVSALAVCGWRDTAVVTFDADFPGAGAGAPPVRTFIVDVWRRENGTWRVAFEQIGVRR
jgi:hypothetical protein